jgi:hypothetical protein
MEEEKVGKNRLLRKSSTPEKQRRRPRLAYGGGTTGRRRQRGRKHINLFEKSNLDELVDRSALHIHRDDDEGDDYDELGTINDFDEDEILTTEHARVKSDVKSLKREESGGKLAVHNHSDDADDRETEV